MSASSLHRESTDSLILSFSNWRAENQSGLTRNYQKFNITKSEIYLIEGLRIRVV